MFRLRRIILLFVLAAWLAGSRMIPAEAAYLTGADLLRRCRPSSVESQRFCESYIAGIIDYHNLIRSLGTAPSVDFCIPRDASIQEVTRQVLKYLARYPEHDHFIASPAVAMALYKTYPCRR